MEPSPLDGRLLYRRPIDGEKSHPRAATTQGQMLRFLGALAHGLSPFEAARHAGKPLSWWRALARRDKQFRAAYKAAKLDFAHAMASQALHTADHADVKSKAGVSKAKLQADVRFKLARVYGREEFGDKVEVDHRNVEVKRTEFVSYFGVRLMKQEQANEEQLRKVLEVGDERADPQRSVAPGSGSIWEEPHAEGVEGGEEGLSPDARAATEAGADCDPDSQDAEGARARGLARRRLRRLTESGGEEPGRRS